MAVKKVQRRTRAPLQKPVQQVLKNKEQKQVTSINKKDKKTVIIAQEIKFARLLSSNDKRVRDKVLKNLRKWLTVRSQSSFAFTESDFMRLWKGLFYCMWMSDKPLIQEELAESLSKIVHCFDTRDVVLLYTTCALKTLGTEWFGIDQYRLDKFSMLVRRIMRQTFEICKKKLWDMEWIKNISEMFEKLLIDSKICLGFSMHVTEVFLEELSKISGGNISEDVITELVKPFISYFMIMDDERQIRHVMRHIFRYLIFQSDIGMDYRERFQAWRAAGFPAGSIDAMDKIEVSDGEMENNDNVEEEFLQNQTKCNTEKPLDPRAGRVDVELPQIPFNAKKITALLAKYEFHPSSTTKSRRQLRRLIKEFTELSQGEMPLGIKEIKLPKTRKKDTDTKLAAVRLLEFEKELFSDKVQKKRKRKRNEQLTHDENAKSVEEELENINGKHSTDIDKADEVNNIEVDKEITKKKRKIQHEMNATNNLIQTKSLASNENIFGLKEKKYNVKEEIRSNSKSDIKSNKLKLKKNKTTTAKILNIVAPVKRKKSTKLKICGNWEVSDTTDSSTLSPSNNNEQTSHIKTIEKLVTNDSSDSGQKSNKQAVWLLPALKKLENEKNRPRALKGQHKVSTNINSKKRVKIALQRNTAQHTSEYILQIRKSPAIPFDAKKKPLAGVLKASPIPSPINPFYKRNII